MNSTGKSIRVAVVDDDLSFREGLIGLLHALGYHSLGFSSAPEFIAFDVLDDFFCLLIDVQMPEMSGFELLKLLKDRGTSPPVILMSSGASDAVRSEALRLGAHEFFDKARGAEDLAQALEPLSKLQI